MQAHVTSPTQRTPSDGGGERSCSLIGRFSSSDRSRRRPPSFKIGVSHFLSTLQINKARSTPRSPPESSPFRARTTSPSKKINTFFSRRFSPLSSGEAKGRGARGRTSRVNLEPARQAPGTPASHRPAAGGAPPFSLAGFCMLLGHAGLSRQPERLPKAGEEGREEAAESGGGGGGGGVIL